MSPCPRCGQACANDATFCTRCGCNLATTRGAGAPGAPAAGFASTRQQQAPRRRGFPIWGVILIVLAGLGSLAVAAILAFVAFVIPHPEASVPATHHLVFTQTGTGNVHTKVFAVGDAWDLSWRYDCATFGHNGNFALVIQKDGTMSGELGPNELGRSNHGTLHFDGGAGDRSLEIVSECDWTVVAYTH